MRTRPSIPIEVRRKQIEASDPAASVWVAANAGSGKTYVLAQRVINLLLSDVAPEKILCITFTKAAAANMSKQVFDRLAEWTTLDDEKLDQVLRDHSNFRTDAWRRAQARRLFARALETPGGLKVQTIHAFCTSLLHQFPFEANVAARFSVLDDVEQSQLLERVTLDVLLEGASRPDSNLARALNTALTMAADRTFRDVVREAIVKHDIINGWVMNAGSVEAAITNLSKTLGIDPAESVQAIETEYFSGTIVAPTEWPALAKTLADGSSNDREQAGRFASLSSLTGSERVETYLDIFFTGERRTLRKSIASSAIKDASLVVRLDAEQERLCKLLTRRRAATCRDRSAALLTVTYEVLTRYEVEKQRRGLLDYDDLIDKTLALLTDVDAAWVHYKLDLGVDHVLVDEAQDTSHKQWEIVRRLTVEFTAGAGARSGFRTMFAVGDEKQSIYSFQNAAPKEFANMLRHFRSAHEKSKQAFLVSKFEHSFRSGASILAAVDEVFKPRDIALSVTSDECGFPPHIALPDTPPGVVEIWEPFKPDPRKEMEGWDAPFDVVSETSPRVKLARRIARAVRKMVGDDAARYGDVLVLVRQRGELFEAIIRALKAANVQVAGADRLVLTEHIAVMDLMALAEALLLREDDLALATVLRSPLFGFSDEDLFDVAAERGRASLRAALQRKAGERQLFADTAAHLDALAQSARHHTPFAFYALLLGEGGARGRFLARLGPEANDALDEFLNLALEYERRETPSLQGFLTWLGDARAEVKRDMEIARNEVRVMTVHGAKGLEARVVILADTMTEPMGPRPPRLLTLADGALIWTGRKDDDVPAVADARQAALTEAEHEYRRLLYVAMTRAADRLIISGADGERRRPRGCWYDLVCEPLKTLLVEEEEGGEKVLRFRKADAGAANMVAASTTETVKSNRTELPSWLREPAPPEAPRPIMLSPSTAFEEEVGRSFARSVGSTAERRKSLARGRIVHRLMQSLPDIPSSGRREAVGRFLKSAATDFSAVEQAEMARHVLAILNDLIFAEVFAPGSRAEVPIVGHIKRNGAPAIAVAGQVDRLAVTRDAVLIVDYKTDRGVPRDLAAVPEPYIAQLALYRGVLVRIYPEKMIRAALVFTEEPRVIEVPAGAMNAALAEIMSKVMPLRSSLDARARRS
jgi:ATP-dependent helicase/nuclease subunit A